MRRLGSGDIVASLFVDPREERLLVDQDSPPDSTYHTVESVGIRVEYQMSQSTDRWPHVMFWPLRQRNEAGVCGVGFVCVLHGALPSEVLLLFRATGKILREGRVSAQTRNVTEKQASA